MVLFPRRSKKPKQGDSAEEDRKTATQHTGPIMPISHAKPAVEKVQITDDLKVISTF